MLRDVGAGLRDIYLLISDVFSGGEVFFVSSLSLIARMSTVYHIANSSMIIYNG